MTTPQGKVQRWEILEGYLLVLPALGIIFFVILYPTIYSLYLSFYSYHLINRNEMAFVGLQNYSKILGDRTYWASITTGLVFTFGSLIPMLIFGLFLASLLNYKGLKLKQFFRGVIVLPWLVPTVTVAIVWKWMFHDLYGVFNSVLLTLGVIQAPIAWLADRHLAMSALIVTNIWRGLPLFVVMFLAGLQSIPEELYDAAKVDGATLWQRFVHVTLPWLRPVIGIAAILRTIWIFNYFDLPWVMTFGGPSNATTTPPVFAYLTTFSSYRLGQGATISVTMFLVLLCFAILYFRYYHTEEV
jgi:ABC-type sugar transport system permease subunit